MSNSTIYNVNIRRIENGYLIEWHEETQGVPVPYYGNKSIFCESLSATAAHLERLLAPDEKQEPQKEA